MVKGIGVDIVELNRITITDRFLKRILTDKEQMIFDQIHLPKKKLEYISGRFAVKEAVAKAFGTGIGNISFQDIEVLNNPEGKPVCMVNGEEIHVSISHSETYVIAFAIREENL